MITQIVVTNRVLGGMYKSNAAAGRDFHKCATRDPRDPALHPIFLAVSFGVLSVTIVEL